MKAYTDLEQSKKLAEILLIESADMVLPFTYKENNEYVLYYSDGSIITRTFKLFSN